MRLKDRLRPRRRRVEEAVAPLGPVADPEADAGPAARPCAAGAPQQGEAASPDGPCRFVQDSPVREAQGRDTGITSAAQVAGRGQAQEEILRHTPQLRALQQVGLDLTSELDLESLLRSIVSRAVDLLEATEGGLYLYRPDEDVLEWALEFGPILVPEGTRLRRGEGLSGKVWETGAPMIVEDYQVWEGRAAISEDVLHRAVVAAPVCWQDSFLGVLDVSADVPRTFSQADAELLSLFANQAAIAIENARLFKAEREQRELAQALEEAAAAVSSTLHLDQVLDRILEQVSRVVVGDAFNIMLVEEGACHKVRQRGRREVEEDGFSASPLLIADYPSLDTMIRTGAPVVVTDTATDPAWVPHEGQEWLRSYMGVPIEVRGVTVGFLNVEGTRPGQFGAADAQRLQAFAPHAATAIENAQLYRELLNHVEQLEQRVRDRTEQLQLQYARLEAILHSVSDGIVVVDADGEILQTNPIAEGWLKDSLSVEDTARLRQEVRALAARAEERPETVVELAGLDLALEAAPITGSGAGETASVVAVHDVSHLKALERMRSRFITSVSHELRTPITTIKLYALLMQRQPEKWQEYLKVLAREADHQSQLVEDILEISRMDAGRLEMSPRSSSLNELTEMVFISHQASVQEHRLTLEYAPALPEPVVLIDPERIVQVLNNLLMNAVQYTPDGGKITISTGKAEKEGRTWGTVTVQDTGFGIPPEELSHVFSRFFRGDQPRAMQMPGTGLGLSIVREIVEMHGGQVTVESQVGEGSTFTVWLPLVDASEAARD